VVDELIPSALHTAEQYANNPIEADHGRLKAWLRPMRGLKRHRSARTLAAGNAFVQNLRRGHYTQQCPYQRGDRIVLVHTSDPHTRLVPGTAGTVTGYDARLGQLAVVWDEGSTLAMLLHDGDQARPLACPGLRPESVPSADGCQPSRKERTVNLGEHAALPGGHQAGGRECGQHRSASWNSNVDPTTNSPLATAPGSPPPEA
jgi:hypothetical protein